MLIARFEHLEPGRPIGVIDSEGLVRPVDVSGLNALLRLRLTEIEIAIDEAMTGPVSAAYDDLKVLPPIDGRTEAWAAGVTYVRSQDARIEESGNKDIYSRVYHSERPELFFKSPAWRVVGTGEDIGIRFDSPVNVPEPELALVVNAFGEIVGYSICNDVSSRTLEAENPLYLPQAKIFTDSCSLGPAIRPSWRGDSPDAFDISVRVLRDDGVAWSGATSTGLMKRSFEEIVRSLYAALEFPEGAVIATGTGLVPEMSFTLAPNDVVEIEVPGIGVLVNRVQVVPNQPPADIQVRPLPVRTG